MTKRFTRSLHSKTDTWCTGEDSNLRSSQGAADLQSAAINHSATCPCRLKTTVPFKQRTGEDSGSAAARLEPGHRRKLLVYRNQAGLSVGQRHNLVVHSIDRNPQIRKSSAGRP